MDYIKTTTIMQENCTTTIKFTKTLPQNCQPHSRCNNHKQCKQCFKIWKNKQYMKAFSHLNESHITQFKYKQLITIVSLNNNSHQPIHKNYDVHNFFREFLKSKRYKSSMMFESEYISMKQISFSYDKGYNPHIHMIRLSNKFFKRDTVLKKLMNKYNVRIDTKTIKPNEDNTYLPSIQKIINYFFKYDENRTNCEVLYKITKGQRDIKKSLLFTKKQIKKDERLYNNILKAKKHIISEKAKINKLFTKQRKEIKQYFLIKITKNPKSYIYWHKSAMKKLKFANSQKVKLLSMLTKH